MPLKVRICKNGDDKQRSNHYMECRSSNEWFTTTGEDTAENKAAFLINQKITVTIIALGVTIVAEATLIANQ